MRHALSPLVLLLLLLTLLPAAPLAAQPPERYAGPLADWNRCGAGDPADVHFTFAATGDTFPHMNIQAVGEAQGYDVLFDYLRPFLQAADIAYTNFDGAMLASRPISGYPNFNYSPALATALKNAGIDLVSTANNHILDHGPAGIDATLAVLEQNSIQQHGTISSAAAIAGEPRPPYLPITLERDGASLRIGFISATWGTNGIADPHGQVNLLYASNAYGNQGDVRRSVLDAIAQARAETDIVIVAAHWGYEYEFYPHPSQEEAARRMAEAGADVILGAQSHTLQPVDSIRSGNRSTLVIYSLANFLASQGAYQAAHFSATSVIFYVGLVRRADGSAAVTGYRYLPTIHVDNDTRPAPVAAGSLPEVVAHVRGMLRDQGGLRRLSADPAQFGERVEVCPPLLLAESREYPIPGDFAQHYLGLSDSRVVRSPAEAIAVFGLPIGPVQREPTADCRDQVAVLYTERQRLELHPEQDWPFRVIGTQVGTEAFKRTYGSTEPSRRTDLAAADAFADPRFRAFYERNGGLAVFGYPISGALSENDPASGTPRTVQYFERARFELAADAPPEAPPEAIVQLGLLGRAAEGPAARCGAEYAPESPPQNDLPPATAATAAPGDPAVTGNARPLWLNILAALAVGVLVVIALGRLLQQLSRPRAFARVQARRRRSARQRLRIDQGYGNPDEE
jgi:poly-gamma-glutamate capsule biosynthesis protein CapA/YwtB (metallophosphatase superfamily)